MSPQQQLTDLFSRWADPEYSAQLEENDRKSSRRLFAAEFGGGQMRPDNWAVILIEELPVEDGRKMNGG